MSSNPTLISLFTRPANYPSSFIFSEGLFFIWFTFVKVIFGSDCFVKGKLNLCEISGNPNFVIFDLVVVSFSFFCIYKAKVSYFSILFFNN